MSKLNKYCFFLYLITASFVFAETHSETQANYFWNPPNIMSPAAAHWITEFSPLSDTIVLEDGSVWHTNPSQRQILSTWKSNDPIVITQNTGWFSGYTYKIINKNLNVAIETNLSLGPLLGGNYTHRIFQIDYNRGEIQLQNGTHFRISSMDSRAFSEWAVNDTIIIGVNSASFSSPDFILLNVEANNFAKSSIVYPPIVSHWVAEISPLSDTIVTEDGAVWHTNPSDRQVLTYWNSNDPLIITQNTGWFSSYSYKIVNTNTNTSVAANISLGPLLDGQYTHRITYIDLGRGEVVLENNSRFSVTDRGILSRWVVNDTIIIGMNSSWFSSSEFILIDVEACNFVQSNLVR